MIDNTLVRSGFKSAWFAQAKNIQVFVPPELELVRMQAALEYSQSHNCRISFLLYGIDCTLDNRQYKPESIK